MQLSDIGTTGWTTKVSPTSTGYDGNCGDSLQFPDENQAFVQFDFGENAYILQTLASALNAPEGSGGYKAFNDLISVCWVLERSDGVVATFTSLAARTYPAMGEPVSP